MSAKPLPTASIMPHFNESSFLLQLFVILRLYSSTRNVTEACCLSSKGPDSEPIPRKRSGRDIQSTSILTRPDYHRKHHLPSFLWHAGRNNPQPAQHSTIRTQVYIPPSHHPISLLFSHHHPPPHPHSTDLNQTTKQKQQSNCNNQEPPP